MVGKKLISCIKFPIPKSAPTSSSPSNYRPISLLSLVSKLLEKHIQPSFMISVSQTIVFLPSNLVSFPIALLFLHFFTLLTPFSLSLNPIPLSVVLSLIFAKLLILFLTNPYLIFWPLLISPFLYSTGFTPTFSTAPNV